MIEVQPHYFGQEVLGLLALAQSPMTQSHHQVAMDEVAHLQIVLPDKQVGQGDRKIVNLHLVEEVLLAVSDEPMETAACLLFITQLPPGQSLIEDFVRLLVVVVGKHSIAFEVNRQ